MPIYQTKAKACGNYGDIFLPPTTAPLYSVGLHGYKIHIDQTNKCLHHFVHATIYSHKINY